MANQTPPNLQQKNAHLARNIAIVVVLIVAVVLYFFLFVRLLSSAIPGDRVLAKTFEQTTT